MALAVVNSPLETLHMKLGQTLLGMGFPLSHQARSTVYCSSVLWLFFLAEK